MFLQPLRTGRRILASDAPVAVFLTALFIFVTFTGMDLLAKAIVKQRASTGVEVAMRYLAVHPDDIAGARDIVASYISNSFIPSTSVTTTAVLDYPTNSCVEDSSCDNVLSRTDGRYYFRDVFTVTSRLSIPPFIPAPFLRTVNTTVYAVGTLEIYGCPAGGCD